MSKNFIYDKCLKKVNKKCRLFKSENAKKKFQTNLFL